MTEEERKPILQDSGVHIKTASTSQQYQQNGQQHFIIQPIEFDHKHRNMYGYLALATFVLVLINYLMIKERSCQISIANGFQNFDLIQSFHMITLIVAVIVFVLSYFNFALVIYEFKLLFYATALLIYVCAGLLVYNLIVVVSAPCVPLSGPGGPILKLLDASVWSSGAKNVFTSGDKIGSTVFFFDLFGALFMFLAGLRFYQRS